MQESPPPLPQVLAALADNAKNNQQGRIDEHGVLQHRLVELCPVGAIALLFFVYFHVSNQPQPKLTPDFSTDGYGEYGYQEWYNYHVFAGKEDFKGPMSYNSELGLPHLSPFAFDAGHRSPQADKCHA